jgi:hypothetical protein
MSSRPTPPSAKPAVIGVPDERWGDLVVAFVRPRPDGTIDIGALRARCREELSGYKRPTAIQVLHALPKNAVGKLDKKSPAGWFRASPPRRELPGDPMCNQSLATMMTARSRAWGAHALSHAIHRELADLVEKS